MSGALIIAMIHKKVMVRRIVILLEKKVRNWIGTLPIFSTGMVSRFKKGYLLTVSEPVHPFLHVHLKPGTISGLAIFSNGDLCDGEDLAG